MTGAYPLPGAVSPIAPPRAGYTYCTSCSERHAATVAGVPYSRLCWPCHRDAEHLARTRAREEEVSP